MQLPKKLYRYLSSKYVEDFVSRGRFRIGTASEYRKPDGLTGARSDRHEGIEELVFRQGAENWLDASHPFVQMVVGEEEAARIFGNRRFQLMVGPGEGDAIIIAVADYFMICCSREVNEQQALRMKAEFGADACVEIMDPELFFRLIHRSISLAGRRGYGGFVSYDRPPELVTFSDNNILRKLPEYEWQQEFRLIWERLERTEKLKGMIIEVPTLPLVLRRVF